VTPLPPRDKIGRRDPGAPAEPRDPGAPAEPRDPGELAQPRVAGVVLAAGSSGRLGEPKPLLCYRGRPFVRRAAEAALAGGLSPVVVVAPSSTVADIERQLADLAPRPTVVVNDDPARGIGSSLSIGAAHVPDEIDAVAVLLADQPLVDAPLVRLIVAAWRDSPALVARPVARGRHGHPVVFDGSLLAELRGLDGGRSGRDVVNAHADSAVTVDVEPDAIFDIDTADDYLRLLRLDINIR